MKENVLDILMYLFENYISDEVELEPDEESLRSELVAAVVQTNDLASVRAGEPGAMSDIIGVITSSDIDEDTMREALRSRLPSYMLPRRIIKLESMPLNASGKIDRMDADLQVSVRGESVTGALRILPASFVRRRCLASAQFRPTRSKQL